MIRAAVSKWLAPQTPAEVRNWPFQFFDNGLGPIRWIDTDENGAIEPQRYLEVSAFHACVRVIAESVAALPFHLIR